MQGKIIIAAIARFEYRGKMRALLNVSADALPRKLYIAPSVLR